MTHLLFKRWEHAEIQVSDWQSVINIHFRCDVFYIEEMR
ncbi:hypothetical protein Deipr_0531 [Deinococcus proteolyticus MRP]|uniref:Uncharacterized protein n=1 Tax=Deinococcus proteolyticus (strain ATCC 35074 / DSM 20540 / JCM 6276 / NBRC 101906 / NCIMB 13154 / VKM Ac-1939 / CCM 2703 / MRP) TaxID=693977 RepID=F0RKK4_DEIPM|nr:hypothetical protein Deipr_0531 [Deinococcus proteolyticus MRP]